jgi:hypothetical protein
MVILLNGFLKKTFFMAQLYSAGRKNMRYMSKSQEPQIRLGANTKCFIVLIVLTLFAAFTNPAQASSGYSDLWLSGTNSPDTVTLAGCGVTDVGYEEDEYCRVETTIGSPNGRSATSSFGYVEGAARVDLSLPFSWDDVGEYQIVSNHESYCVHGDGGEILPMYGSTFFGVGIAIKASGWGVSADDGVKCYLEATCSGTCVNIGELHIYTKGPGVASCNQGGNYQQLWELYAFGTCYHNTRTGVGRNFPGSCD